MATLLEYTDLDIDFGVAPVFPLQKVIALRAFVFRVEADEAHLAMALDLDNSLRDKDIEGGALPFSPAFALARQVTGRNEVLLYQISDRALQEFLKVLSAQLLDAIKTIK